MADLGTVYFYNLFNETATLSLNGEQVIGGSSINGWDQSNGYSPSSLAVESAQHSDANSGKAYRGGDGANTIRIDWESGYATGDVTLPTVADDVPIGADLVVYVAKNSAFVEDTEGFIHGTQQKLDFHAPS